jgi:hypothetical protein
LTNADGDKENCNHGANVNQHFDKNRSSSKKRKLIESIAEPKNNVQKSKRRRLNDQVFDRLSKRKRDDAVTTSEERVIRQARSERERFKEEYTRWQKLYAKIRDNQSG